MSETPSAKYYYDVRGLKLDPAELRARIEDLNASGLHEAARVLAQTLPRG